MERTIRVASLRAPDARDLRSMKTWVEDQDPLGEEETSHLLGGTDFVALVGKEEECWLDDTVERALSKYLPRDVWSFSILAMSNSNCPRASLLRRSSVVLVTIQTFVYVVNTALMY